MGHPNISLKMSCSLSEQFPDRWISHACPQNWPPWSQDLSPLDFHLWSYMRNMMYECTMDMSDEIFHWIFIAALHANDAAGLLTSQDVHPELQQSSEHLSKLYCKVNCIFLFKKWTNKQSISKSSYISNTHISVNIENLTHIHTTLLWQNHWTPVEYPLHIFWWIMTWIEVYTTCGVLCHIMFSFHCTFEHMSS